MLLGSSPKKRKSESNEDQTNGSPIFEENKVFSRSNAEDDETPRCSTKRSRHDSPHYGSSNFSNNKSLEGNKRLDRLRNIIARELSREMQSKVTQLEFVDKRLEEAKNLLDRLRYAIVAEYYRKQEQPLTMVDAAIDFHEGTPILDKGEHLPQIPIHPSLKKIIGKRPQNLADIMRANPKREAAKNASHVFNTKSAAERREERRLQKVIREQGIVIDHSKQNVKAESEANQGKKRENTKEIVNSPKSEDTKNRLKGSTPHVLNKTRTKNKIKCHFVVGNTSKYIGKDEELAQADTNTSFSHKWLVYVQTKDTEVPIEKYIKKVRFFLHPSYRPNDVVDIHEPPFQVARRGWGEFPIRIQLFFHESFQQKPVQLIHKVVLDITKSGRHILGAETVVEIWLRNESLAEEKQAKCENEPSSVESISTIAHSNTSASQHPSPETKRKPRTISFNMRETFDDNFFDFLNKIEESRTSICADIEKIEPTLLVNEPLEAQFSNTIRSPLKNQILSSPIKVTSSQLSPSKTISLRRTPQNMYNQGEQLSRGINAATLPKAIKDATTRLLAAVDNNAEQPISELHEEKTNNIQASQIAEYQIISNASLSQYTNTMSSIPCSTSNRYKKVNMTSCSANVSSVSVSGINSTASLSGKTFNNLSGTIILPVKKEELQKQYQSEEGKNGTQISVSNGNLSQGVYQKKMVQVKNAQGQIKMVQMFVVKPLTFKSTSSSIRITAPTVDTLSNTTDISASTLVGNSNLKNPVTTSLTTVTNSIHGSLNPKIHVRTAESCISTSNLSQKLQQNTVIPAKTPASNISKNVVFQKEGKLYIIDPLQMKLKQQCKNQVSLLKPQVKQQSQQRNAALQSITSDHDYTPPPAINQNSVPLLNYQNETLIRSPQLHLGMRETRLSALKTQDHQKWQRTQFERKFNDTAFTNMRSAVEYLLRRLPLIETNKKSTAAAFPFVKTSPQEFNSLPAFKQRSFEWLRAKFIGRLLRTLKSLQTLNASGEEQFWSTREIATFARFHAYTPPIKALHQENEYSDIKSICGATHSKEQFSALIKTEIKTEQLQIEYNTLSPVSNIIEWVNNIQQRLKENDSKIFNDEVIIVDGDDEYSIKNSTSKDRATSKETTITKRIYGSPLKFSNNSNSLSYLAIPPRLETAFQFVGDICKDLSIRLQPEEIVPGVIHPSAQIALAHVSQLFIERLLRQTIANQIHEQGPQINKDDLPHNNNERIIALHDLQKTISQSSELDFLTNRRMGVPSQSIKNE